MSPSLATFTPALGPQPANAHFYSAHTTTLHMKEKVFSITGDDFTIKTVDGTEVCKCKGKVISLKDKKKFVGTDGKEIFTLGNKMLSIHKSFHAESPTGHDFEVHGHWKMIGSRSTVTFKNAADGNAVELEILGSWMDRSAEIKWGGRQVAHISRSFFNVREMFGDKQTYFVTVAPNVDLSMIAAICVSLDERENEDK
ncbi:hypothetical protein LTR36_002304 [Oleoguttula mirabilis]|uniref:Uncharacterized protein n=1 Tax=Oleoguttula mirabilis TaxID=1507867 RepID=A0AAV9JLG9_9PEZI|nr:hypothetical protein LTR36_002304 [Oleoguttula mirabilis]